MMTDAMDEWTEVFERDRPRLLGLAYRTLGVYSDAEDVVQEAWVRTSGVSLATIDNPSAWLTTVTSRLALDRLRHLSRRREDYVGPWLPEPVSLAVDPAASAEIADSLTFGFLVLLDRLTPVERVVFLLADVFAEPYTRIAGVVGKSEDACRQIASRARRRLRSDPDVPSAGPADRALVEALVGAIIGGDEASVMSLLAPDVCLTSDGGPERRAARRPVVGPDRVARFLVNLARRLPVDSAVGWQTLNGQEALVVSQDGLATAVLLTEVDDGRVVTLRWMNNPDKLQHLDREVPIV